MFWALFGSCSRVASCGGWLTFLSHMTCYGHMVRLSTNDMQASSHLKVSFVENVNTNKGLSENEGLNQIDIKKHHPA